MPKEKPFTVFGYVRVSTENQLENYSIEEQASRLTAYCKAKGWNLYKIYQDGGYSGGSLNRPALQQMLSDLARRRVSAVVVYKLDRLSRSQKDTLTLIEDRFLSQGVDFISINENFDTSSPFGRAMIGILSVFAQLEKDQITERFTMGRIGRGKAGFYHGGGSIPLGYNYIDGNLVVNEFEAAQVREVFQGFLAGKSIHSIADAMEKKYGSKWSAAKTRYILQNSTYIGKVKFAGAEYEGRHSPIISKEQFEEANSLLHSEKREAGKNTSQKAPFRAETLLSGLLYCKRCGAKYTGSHGKYRCNSRSKNSRRYVVDPSCKNEHWPIELLDAQVVHLITNFLIHPGFFEALDRMPEEARVNEKAVKKRLRELNAQLERLLDLYQLGSLPVESLNDRIRTLNFEAEVLRAQLIQAGRPEKRKKGTFAQNTARFLAGFDNAPLETRRLLIGSLVDSIWIDGHNVEIKWRV